MSFIAVQGVTHIAASSVPSFLVWLIWVIYGCVVLLICVYGLHRYWLLWMFARVKDRRRNPACPSTFAELPQVLIQLPMFNEVEVAERIIQAAARIDYPADRLRIQVLDDSTDESANVARRCVESLQAEGVAIEYVHREDRTGYKAGALAAGLAADRASEFVAVFDADFIPHRTFLHETIHYLAAEDIGFVQIEWSHINRHESLLTECQAMFLDGHFMIEQTARHCNRRWFNFNGTAGIWRRTCIDDAGGWQHDTLTEDADLSYRAQLAGWRAIYLPEVQVPAELPSTTRAFLSQQHRWNKGLTQTALKLMPRILRSKAPLGVKLEAWFHLTSPVIYVAMIVLMLLALPAFLMLPSAQSMPLEIAIVVGAGMLGFGTFAAGAFYVVAQFVAGLRVRHALLYLPILMAIGIGLSVVNTRGVIGALCGVSSPFIRTPKSSQGSGGRTDPAALAGSSRWWARLFQKPGLIEIVFGMIASVCYVLSFVSGSYAMIGAPFLLLFAAGYFAVGIPAMRGNRKRDSATRQQAQATSISAVDQS
ncbi:MAG: glycosyltransferase [Phycisphaerales bacterium]